MFTLVNENIFIQNIYSHPIFLNIIIEDSDTEYIEYKISSIMEKKISLRKYNKRNRNFCSI